MKSFVRLAVATLLTTTGVAAAQTAPTPADPAPPVDPVPPAVDPGNPPQSPPPAPDSGQGAQAPNPSVTPAQPVTPAAAPTVPKGPEWTTLRLLHDKGVISDAELDSALKDIGITGAGDATTMVVSKIRATIYGFAQADYHYESTESCVDFCSNAQIQKPGTYRGDHGRTLFSPRDSRFGVRLSAPVEHGIKVSGLLETDFEGPTATTEQGTFSNPVLRVRHAYLKMETPVVDLLFGQTWSLFGYQPNFLLTSVQLPGLPGQMFQRTTQLKVSKTIKGGGVTTELAIAGNRAPQQDSAMPEGVAGVRVSLDKWTAQHSAYLTSTTINPASIAISGDLRGFRIPEFAAVQHKGETLMGGGVAVDVFLPLIKGTKDNKDNSLAVTGELSIGKGTSDMYTALGAAGTANAAIPAAPVVPPATPAAPTAYPSNFDPGLAAVDALGHAELIKWTTWAAGAEYYAPGTDGRLGLFFNYQHSQSANAKHVGTAAMVGTVTQASADAARAKIRDQEDLFE
ncbi:MAG TPA: hypothetical protein VGC42_27735, partial [Kofleriaceae bacterium]